MPDIKIPWKKIVRGLPKGREAANDRAPTVEEIRKLIDYPDTNSNEMNLFAFAVMLSSWSAWCFKSKSEDPNR